MLDSNITKYIKGLFAPRSLVRRQREAARAFEPNAERYKAKVIEVAGSVYGHNQPNFVWILPIGVPLGPRVVWNNRVNAVAGLPVWVGPHPNEPQREAILDIYTEELPPDEAEDVNYFTLPPHGFTHEIPSDLAPGLDPTRIFQPAIQIFKSAPNGADLTVSTQPYAYQVNGVRTYFPGTTTDLTPYLPGAGEARRVLVYLDPETNTLNVREGDVVPDLLSIPVPFPDVPRKAIGSAWFSLVDGQALLSAIHYTDARPFLDTWGVSEPYEATRQGQILYSLDAATFIAALPVVDPDTMGLVIDPDTFTIVVVT